jgi:hypothetical protein
MPFNLHLRASFLFAASANGHLPSAASHPPPPPNSAHPHPVYPNPLLFICVPLFDGNASGDTNMGRRTSPTETAATSA